VILAGAKVPALRLAGIAYAGEVLVVILAGAESRRCA